MGKYSGRLTQAVIVQLVIVVGMLTMAGCGTSTLAPDNAVDATLCEDPRPMVCTMEYMPVCANLAAGGTATYPSGCNACADIAVSAWRPEPCEE